MGLLVKALVLLSCCLFVFSLDVFIDSYADNNGSGSNDNPYSSISQAITNTISTSTSINYILFPGIYQGSDNLNITITSKNIQFQSYSSWSEKKDETTPYSDKVIIGEVTPSLTASFLFISGEGSLIINDIQFYNLSSVITYSSINHKTTNEHPISILNSSFHEIHSQAITIQGINEFTMENCVINYCHGSWLAFTGNTDEKGSASISNIQITDSAGIYIVNIQADLNQLNFSNLAQRGIFFNPSKGSSNSISNCNFIAPLASVFQGSAIYIQSTATSSQLRTKVDITECNFNGAQAIDGGAIWISNVKSTIEKSTFSQCSANEGGAIGISAAIVSVFECSFSQNIAIDFASAIYIEQESTVQLANNSFVDFNPDNRIYCDSGLDMLVFYGGNFTATNCNITTIADYDYSQYFSFSSVYSSSESESSESGSFDILYGYIFIAIQAMIICIIIAGIGIAYYYYKFKYLPTQIDYVDHDDL